MSQKEDDSQANQAELFIRDRDIHIYSNFSMLQFKIDVSNINKQNISTKSRK